MRGNGKAHAFRFARMVREKLEIILDGFLWHERFGKRHPNRGTNSHILDHLHGTFSMPVHIGKEHRPGLDHLEYGKARRNTDIVTRKFGLERPDIFLQPLLERHIVGIPAQERHGRMRMPVVECRENSEARAVHDFGSERLFARNHPDACKAVPHDKHVHNLVAALTGQHHRLQ